jgi:hypothetical protein
MAPKSWASTEEEVFVNTFYGKYQNCQAKRDYNTFWAPFFEAWNERFPEHLFIFPDIPLDEDLTDDQRQVVSQAFEKRKHVRK